MTSTQLQLEQALDALQREPPEVPMSMIVLRPGWPPLNSPEFLAQVKALHTEHNPLDQPIRGRVTTKGRVWLSQGDDDNDDDDDDDDGEPEWVDQPGEVVEMPFR